MTQADIVNRVMFDWGALSQSELDQAIQQLPRKLLRWIGTNHPDNRTRKQIFQRSGIRIADDAVVNTGAIFMDNYEDLITIGARVSIAPNVLFVADMWPNNSRLTEVTYVANHLCRKGPIVIEDDAWIGAGVVILPGVKIGRAAIVGAGAVVTRDVAPMRISAGVPAREVRQL